MNQATMQTAPDIEKGGEQVEKPPVEEVFHPNALPFYKQNWFVVALILLLGGITSGAFIWLGVSSANQVQEDEFQRSAQDLVSKIESAWDDYVNAASWVHGRCRDRDFDRREFREIYEYLISSGLDFQAMQFDPNITHDERDIYEDEARQFYAEFYPEVEYRGFIGFNTVNSTTLEPRWPAPFYFPIHYMEPVIGNAAAIGLDYHASGSRKRTVLFCMNEGMPALTDRLNLVQETEQAFGVVLMHPGIELSNPEDTWPKDIASIVIRIPDLLIRAGKDQGENSKVYLFDNDDTGGTPVFLGAAEIESKGLGQGAIVTRQEEISLDALRKATPEKHVEDVIRAANKEWTVFVHTSDDSFEASHTVAILGGCIIFCATAFLAFWVWSNTRRIQKLNMMKAEADAERAALIIDNANQSAKAERELNDFIAHEVRNPVAAAMAATAFVKAEVSEEEPMKTEESKQSVRDDVDIISNALKFVNDLLRNMLDMHRASNKQMKVELSPADLLHDVMEPVHAMLQQRGTKISFVLDCPADIFVMTDRLRLKQVLLNLGRNSSKFVEEGFVRLVARIVDDHVELAVEDSGPGVPMEKRDKIFNKFQESLDMLSQGTGIGLHLCKNLVDLMGGEIYLDESFDSGIEGCPGSRFVVNLKQSPLDPEKYDNGSHRGGSTHGSLVEAPAKKNGPKAMENGASVQHQTELPTEMSVLFVDDDPILRKLFIRTARTVAPTWEFREASNGETALKLTDESTFDLIFVDMYMASVEKQLLGTETVVALRQKGVNNRICGLSANDKETEFLEAGADAFSFKPFPCEKKALTQELLRILYYVHPDGEHREIRSNVGLDED